tara:strand:+ start:1075 stop:1668 length:594 start_codon:yes stop_codon:yes gene_type:complete
MSIKQAIPSSSIVIIDSYLLRWKIQIKIVRKRKTKHGDFRRKKDGTCQITINDSQNKYRFLITLIHELAHFISFEEYGYKIKPHGVEWKRTFKRIMFPLLMPSIFPDHLLSRLAEYLINPKATTDSDFLLSLALKKFDIKSDKVFIFELLENSLFILENGKKFKKGKKRIKRFECIELNTEKTFLFSPHAEVNILQK